MLNSTNCEKTIIVKCRMTDLYNEHIKSLITTLCGILPGIAAGTGIAKLIDLSTPDIPLIIAAVMVAAGLMFCIQQILMQSVEVTMFPEKNDQFELIGKHLYWFYPERDHNGRHGSSIFASKFTVCRRIEKGQPVYRFSGKPSPEFIERARSISRDKDANKLYFFKSVTFVLTPNREQDAPIRQLLTENNIVCTEGAIQ